MRDVIDSACIAYRKTRGGRGRGRGRDLAVALLEPAVLSCFISEGHQGAVQEAAGDTSTQHPNHGAVKEERPMISSSEASSRPTLPDDPDYGEVALEHWVS